MLEPSDNGITFEGLIDALMVSFTYAASQYLLLLKFLTRFDCKFVQVKNYVTQGFVRRVQSSEVKKQEPADFCFHLHFPGIAT